MSFQDRKRSNDRLGIIIIIICSILVIASGAFMFSSKANKVKVDKETFCPKNSQPLGKVVALIDLTDPLNQAQKEFFLKEIENIKQDIPKYHSLVIYTLDESLDLKSTKKLIKCNPGTLEDIKNTFEKISTNPVKIKNDWEKRYSKEISDSINRIIEKSKPQNSSPVMEMFQLISIREFKNFKGSTNKIIILSDMIQNTPGLSMYSNKIPNFDDFIKTSYFSKIRTDLKKKVDVNLWIIKRDGYRKLQESRSFLEFWARFFTNGNEGRDFRSKFVDG